jgi:hypothetical protein
MQMTVDTQISHAPYLELRALFVGALHTANLLKILQRQIVQSVLQIFTAGTITK